MRRIGRPSRPGPGPLRRAERMVVTDLDGTLLGSGGAVSAANVETLRWLGCLGVVRVVATGRSPFSLRRVLAPDFPLDFVIFSTGLGIVDWPRQRLLHSASLADGEVRRAVAALRSLRFDLMVHEPVPDNHRFHYTPASTVTERENPDFLRRLGRYAAYATQWRGDESLRGEKSQIVAIAGPGRAAAHREVTAALPELSVVRATSPLDGRSVWVEVLPRGVSKSWAASWIADRLHIEPEATLAVGNDFNDHDLLAWSGTGAVVANAPAEMRRLYPVVPSNDGDGFTAAVRRWQTGAG